MKTIAALVLLLGTLSNAWAEDERTVGVKTVEQRPLSPKLMVIGTVHSRSVAELTSGVSGKLQWVQEPGERVMAGDTVARLDDTQLKLQLAEQQALVEREQISLSRLERNLSRLERLAGSQSISRTELDDTRSDRDLANSNLTLAKVRLDIIRDNLRRTELKAPFSGIVIERRHQSGEDIGPAEPVLTITDPDHLELRLHAPLKHSRRVSIGDSLKVYHAQGEFSARIRSLIPVSDVRSQTFEARLDLPADMAGNINIGELVSLALPIAPATLTTLVPRDALVLRSSGVAVFRVGADNTAERIPVTLGDGEGPWIAVEGELSAGDQVVVRGAETLSDGMKLKIKDDKPQTVASTR
ncbi:efflux RND transporter periplasmic adaptor subunit [Shewanella sp. JM162201]|uniref:Efflux RND transporter periplasmic adaptor subunit n=1 Tax=Shewanella jiangmenensis TaxID=2837387 RepID=A0ABS5V6P7_9GAMM|nr:efflux RND transporter periplasmic adaptor subunit [Shewanella jiangmenensis]MBT1446114.1 efflux RND transporter periplasmic adaptor subunit [Shewanella jiangmenensis]